MLMNRPLKPYRSVSQVRTIIGNVKNLLEYLEKFFKETSRKVNRN